MFNYAPGRVRERPLLGEKERERNIFEGEARKGASGGHNGYKLHNKAYSRLFIGTVVTESNRLRFGIIILL